MQDYGGSQPFAPLATPNGFGIWPTPQVVNGGNTRSAQNHMTAVEGMIDRGNWLGHRIIDFRSGGLATYTMQGSVKFNLSGLNGWIFACLVDFSGAASIIDAGVLNIRSTGGAAVFAGSTLRIGKTGVSAGFLTVESGSKITAKNGGDIIIEDTGSLQLKNTAHFSLGGTATATLAGTTTQTGPYKRSGANGWTKLRRTTAANGAIIADARDFDVIQMTDVGNTGSVAVSCSITLSQPPNDAEVGIPVRVFAPRGMATSGTNSDWALITVTSAGVDAGGEAFGPINSSNETAAPVWMDLMIVEAAGGTQRKWIATGASTKTPV